MLLLLVIMRSLLLTHVVAVASPTLKQYGDLTGNSSYGRYRDLFAAVDVSLKQRLKLYCF